MILLGCRVVVEPISVVCLNGLKFQQLIIPHGANKGHEQVASFHEARNLVFVKAMRNPAFLDVEAKPYNH